LNLGFLKSYISLEWHSFFRSFQKDFKVILLCSFFLTIFRCIMILTMDSYLSKSVNAYDLFIALFIGLRFDLSVGGYFALPSFFATVACGMIPIGNLCDYVRKAMISIFFCLSAVALPANYVFFLEFKDNFNQWIFGAIYDDFGAVLQSAWSEYPLAIISIMTAVVTAAFIWISLKFIKRPFTMRTISGTNITALTSRVFITLLMVMFFAFCIRGSVGSRPVQQKDAGITPDFFLNKLVLNPFYALKYTVQEHLKLNSVSGIQEYLPDGNIEKAAMLFFEKDEPLQDLDAYMKKYTKGHGNIRPEHIFLIIMESMDSWSLLEKYSSFNLLPNLKQLGEEGLLVKGFLPSGHGTMPSLAAVISGLPSVGVFTNYQESASRPFPTSIAPQFERLGYETNLFYGGYLSWERLGDFTKAQGFDDIYGGGNMSSWSNNEWGVEDNALFEFIFKTLEDNTPSFNLVMSTSYHPPYDLPVYEHGFPYHEIPETLSKENSTGISSHVFGHLWYADKMLGEFVRKVEVRFPNSLFAVTGDHWSRRVLNAKPTMYERSSVPLLLYGKNILKNINLKTTVAGCHLDIMPTLLELSAPPGFEYYSMGTDLLASTRRQLGFSDKEGITTNYIVGNKGKAEQLPFSGNNAEEPDVTEIRALHNAWNGIGWWRIMNGSEL